jgi:hemoglobin/transferrin/lactoferrin receptor protein
MNIFAKLCFYSFLICSISTAQTARISGKVTDAHNRELSSVNVSIKGTSRGATSAADGSFQITNITPGRYTLVVTHIGYQAQSVDISVEANEVKKVSVVLRASALMLQEVIVTSTKYEKKVKDVSLPLSVVRANKISQVSPVTVADVLCTEPGVSLSRDGIWATDVNIRGLSKQNVVALVDGNRIETATNIAAGLSLVDVTDIERVEVIKGAASSLYGSGAVGGVVNIITKGGSYSENLSFNGSLTSGFGTVNQASLGRLALAGGNRSWFAKLSSTVRNAGDTRTPQGVLENSQFEDNNISADAGFRPFDNHELVVRYQRFKAKDVGIPGGKPFPPQAKATYPEEEREMVSAEYKVKNITSSLSNVSVKYFHQYIFRDVELVPNPVVTTRPSADHNTNGLQLQSNWTFGENNFFVAGIDAWQRDLDSRRQKILKNANEIIGEKPIPNSSYRSIGLFAQDELGLLQQKLRLTLGGRFDHIKVSNDKAYDPAYIIVNGVRNDNPPGQELLWQPTEATDVSWSGNIGLLYKLKQELDLCFSGARSFRSPSLEERYQYILLGADTYLGNPNLQPERGSFFDVGVRLWKPAVQITANVFLNSLNNLVIDRAVNDSLYVKSNVGSARLYGFDAGASYNFYQNVVAYTSAAYVRGRDTETSTDLPEIPPFNGRLGLRSPLWHLFDVDLAASFFAGQHKVAKGEMTTPGYAYFDMYLTSRAVSLAGLRTTFNFAVENLTNRAYRNHLASNRGLVSAEPGRNFKVSIRLSTN